MKGSKRLMVMMLLMIMLLSIVMYRYGYLEIQRDISSIKEAHAMKTKIIEKYITLISEIPNLEKELASLKEIRGFYNTEMMIEGETYSIASASLQDMVKGIITGMGGKVSSERMGQILDLGKFKVINVSIDGAVPDVKTLSDTLYAIETHTPSLFVREIDVNIRDYREPRELTIKLNVSALTSEK
ncbi:MAG: hypothetical protein HZC11_03870 [Nitrospirae bacterium]|nr:hypothetical protein [Nitrospirota bacterium]